MEKKRWLLLGASRGLGFAFLQLLTQQRPQDSGLLISRKAPASVGENWKFCSLDFSKSTAASEIQGLVSISRPDYLVYFAGGGPFGEFPQKNFKDHQWAFQVNFLTPAELIHSCREQEGIRTMVFIGSAIAENAPDPGAASYSASKHALRGLISSLSLENSLPFKVELFSPGYMKTDLLPRSKWEDLAAMDPNHWAMLLYEKVRTDFWD